jgi:hypothetical protein
MRRGHLDDLLAFLPAAREQSFTRAASRPASGGKAAHARRSAQDCSRYGQAAGAVA